GGLTASPAITDPVDPIQCFRFREPLGYSASGALEQGDTKWYVLQLGNKGAVIRPLFPKRQREMWTRRSHWTAKDDTLFIRVFDGLVGWDISLRRERNGLTGVATYLSDVRVAGWVPPRLNVSAAAVKCPASSA
ncbi:MAG TPA: hypothetical protein VK555_13395, partial [Terriglobales bacterium]|nr:hypothetical protein [Terriglobales bacterium]